MTTSDSAVIDTCALSSQNSLTVEATRTAARIIRGRGLQATDIDGSCGSGPLLSVSWLIST
jgi:hypothetical protein